jgi:hypothetical protein
VLICIERAIRNQCSKARSLDVAGRDCRSGVRVRVWRPESHTPNRRGAAELELLLVIPVLLVILFLASGLLAIGTARMRNAYNAENDVYGQVVAGRGVRMSSTMPPDGLNAIWPELPFYPSLPNLPNHYAEADESAVVVIKNVKGVAPVTLKDTAYLLDPAWQYSAWTQNDQDAIQEWFKEYVDGAYQDAAQLQDTRAALELSPECPP